MKYYYLTGPSNYKYATAKVDPSINNIEIWDLIEGLKSRDEWSELRFTFGDGEISDIPPTNLLGKICSKRLKNILEPFTQDGLWLPVKIFRKSKEFEYYFLLFPKEQDVLDNSKSKFVRKNKLLKPHLSLDKVGARHVICLSKLSEAMIVSEKLRTLITSKAIVGTKFLKVDAS